MFATHNLGRALVLTALTGLLACGAADGTTQNGTAQDGKAPGGAGKPQTESSSQTVEPQDQRTELGTATVGSESFELGKVTCEGGASSFRLSAYAGEAKEAARLSLRGSAIGEGVYSGQLSFSVGDVWVELEQAEWKLDGEIARFEQEVEFNQYGPDPKSELRAFSFEVPCAK